MDSLWFGRLERFLATKLKVINKTNIGRVVAHICEFVETIPGLESFEKQAMSLTWLVKLIPGLTEDEINTIRSFLDTIIDATKGVFAINAHQPPQPSSILPNPIPTQAQPAQRKFFGGKPKPPACLDSDNRSIN